MSKAAKKTTKAKTKVTKTKKTAKKTAKKTSIIQGDFIVLDCSGSMVGLFDEALGGINSYVKKLAEDKVDTAVTLVAFDSNEPFKIVRNRVKPSEWTPVTHKDCTPRGLTPLNDATMETFSLIDAGQNSKKYDRVSLVIATDGYENCSREFSILNGGTQKVKDRIKKAQEAGWAVTFLGANFDNVAQAASYGGAIGQTVSTTAANFGSTMAMMATKRGLYASSGEAATMSWSADEQASAKGDGSLLKKKVSSGTK